MEVFNLLEINFQHLIKIKNPAVMRDFFVFMIYFLWTLSWMFKFNPAIKAMLIIFLPLF